MSGDAPWTSPVGVLVLRVWWESPDPGGLRLHVRAVADIGKGEEEVVAVSSIPEAVGVVRRWLVQRAAEFRQSS